MKMDAIDETNCLSKKYSFNVHNYYMYSGRATPMRILTEIHVLARCKWTYHFMGNK